MHVYVEMLRFARLEFVRAFEGLTSQEALQRIGRLNSLSWMVGHLANQERRYWLEWAQGSQQFVDLNELVGTGKPPSTPPLDDMWAAWEAITLQADAYLDTLTPEHLTRHMPAAETFLPYDIGGLVLRNIYHYWFHTGEALAVRQMLGHTGLPEFVGEMPHFPHP
jgi:hypothetical protein